VEALDAVSAWAGGDSATLPAAPVASAADQATPVQRAEVDAKPRVVVTEPIDLLDHLEQSQEALSRRLGEALAARMLAQIEKGDWQIRLSVAPAHLGPIDIDLQARGLRMEAQFQVAHGQTQVLIQDSLPRLREAVGASGMDLASVWVSGGWNERNRGNPTPGQPNHPALSTLKEGGSDEPEVSGAPLVDSRGPRGVPRAGGVDVLI
jgi:flagellar hook-length control protein FliK